MHHVLPVDNEIELRSWRNQDAPNLLELILANRAHLAEWLPWLDQRGNLQQVADYITHCQFSAISNKNRFYGIWADNELVGEIARTGTSEGHFFCSMSYWLGSNAQGRGIVHRAAGRLLQFNFTEMGMNRMEIRVAMGNARSRQVVERLGFQYEGYLRQIEWLNDHFVDHEVFSLLRAEWEAQTPAGQ
ncbi:MAG: GNAT family protein [Bacteroidota bacterium]